ncbi:uncharacterized protein [Amphiura filiformis]|uniref:uncharacterized protein n=1 Tax=Amphiura filiformis TaxID=82378 RepID=UPI003B20DD51
MAMFRIVSRLMEFSVIFLCLCCVFWRRATGTLHVMSVTPTPYGANSASTYFTCLLSQPDTDLVNNIHIGRHVLKGTTPPDDTLSLPVGSGVYNNTIDTLTQYLPTNTRDSVGVYYCEASKSGLTTRVPVSIMSAYRLLQPSSGQFTVTVNSAEHVDLQVDVLNMPQNDIIIWEKQGDQVDDFMMVYQGGTQYTINGATEQHAGVYHTYWNGFDYAGSLIRLIVRGCSHGKWGPPSCKKICDNCYNGGICDDKTGECVCRPGFTGPNCLTACGENRFGWDCEHECGVSIGVPSCLGSMFCMPDPVGCSCMTGWLGTECNQACPAEMYGAGCTQFCNCQSGSCDRFTGRCDDGMCLTGWSGDNCQRRCDDGMCLTGWSGDCQRRCDDGMCLTGWSGDNCQISPLCNTIHCLRALLCMGCPSEVNNADACLVSMEISDPQDCPNGASQRPENTKYDFILVPTDTCPAGYYGDECLDKCYCNNCNKTTGCMFSQCFTGLWGEQCENQCNNCYNCGKTTGCMNSQCHTGYWGEQCQLQCNSNCNDCDKSTGCMNSQCPIGYWGEQCDTECHCLNGVACDKETGKCSPDLSTGLSLCEPGYASTTGVNLENCQRYASCFAGCTKTCHCSNYVPCNHFSGQCPVNTFCDAEWGGASCQTGIIEFGYEKTNPNQALQVTCIVTGDQVIPTADQVTLEYYSDNRLQTIGEQVEATSFGIGRFLTIVILITPNATHPVPLSFMCSVRFEENGLQAYANAWVIPQYFVPLTLTSTPEIFPGTITPTSMTIQWDAWNPNNGDTGDGPVIGYIIYDEITMTKLHSVTTVYVGVTLSRNIVGLTPNTYYQLTVRPVREGPGGEGFATHSVAFITLPSPTLSSPIYPPSTARTTTERLPPPDVQTSPPPPDKPTLPSDSDMNSISTIMSTGKTSREETPQVNQVPGPPRNSSTVSIKQTSITLEWNEPAAPNGIITFYHIDHRVIQGFSQGNDVLVGPFTNATKDIRGTSDTQHTFYIGNLEAGTMYEMYISAENAAGEGASILHRDTTLALESNLGLVAGSTTGAVMVALVIIVIILVVIIRRKHGKQTTVETPDKDLVQGSHFENQAFNPDTGGYEDVDLDDQEYEEVTSSQWDIAWEDLNLSGQILGKGNFGDVQMAKVKIRNKWVMAAVKTLKQGTPESERILFKEEFDTMTKIGHHPNVVNILGSCEHAGSFYVVLEYVHHGNLRKFLRKCRKESKEAAKKGQAVTNLSPDQLLNFAIGVAKAMKHISDCGIIHRDLAARNILVGRGYTPKVSDFGMSREQDVYVQASSRRVPTRWLSIESMTKKMYSTKSDVWSFGILLWEIVTFGGTPYSDMETKHLAYQLTDGYRMPKPENCEDDMYQLMLQCWHEDPDARPSFKDIVDILTNMATQDKIYMSTHFYENFKYAAISLDKDDK